MVASVSDDMLQVGMVVGIHGLRGDLKIRPLSGEATVLTDAKRIWLTRAGSVATEYVVQRSSWHKGNLLFHLERIVDADSAQALVGSDVLLPDSELTALDDDEYYWFELEGLRVVDRQRGELGTLDDIFTTPAHDIYVVRGADGEILIPAVAAFILDIDLEQETMLVDLPDGLLPERSNNAL